MKQLRPYQQQAVKECWQSLCQDDQPVLLMASVGSGKSLMLADILIRMQNLGKHALCIVNNAELVRNNCATFKEQGGNASIYCAALGEKDVTQSVIFGTPQSILNGVNKNEKISEIKFNIIVVDEAHAINYLNDSSVFVRILRFYKQEYPEMRVLGATGTNFRFKGNGIVGNNCFFKRQVGNIDTEYLIDNDYLIRPTFRIDQSLVLDFSKVRIKSTGQFDSRQLGEVVEKSHRLSELICQQIIHIMQTNQRRGIFIFATNKKHAEEIYSYLPMDDSAIILGETPQHERTDILDKARDGRIKYLVNIAIISVGVDVPAFDTIAYLRPTESLVLLVQTMGRVLRLSPDTGKSDALVLDFAGNIERHRDWDSPLLLDALEQTVDKDKPKVILCPCCQEMNTDTARRCVGTYQKKRCDYYFEFKDCPNASCGVKNDIAARNCRLCQTEIIDPNKKLSLKIDVNTVEFEVVKTKYAISKVINGFRINCVYTVINNRGRSINIYESYVPNSEKSKHYFYGNFIKKHSIRPNHWYPHIYDADKMAQMLEELKSPTRITINKENKIKSKYFIDESVVME